MFRVGSERCVLRVGVKDFGDLKSSEIARLVRSSRRHSFETSVGRHRNLWVLRGDIDVVNFVTWVDELGTTSLPLWVSNPRESLYGGYQGVRAVD